MDALAADPAQRLHTALARRRRQVAVAFVLLAFLVVAVAVASLGLGAVAIPPGRTLAVLWSFVSGAPLDQDMTRDAVVILTIRLPRSLLGLMVGAALAVSGALMQGLFRNPLADPGLVGVERGCALGRRRHRAG